MAPGDVVIEQVQPLPARRGGQLRGSSLLLAAQVAAAAGAFATSLVIARTLGPSGRGTYAFALTIAPFMALVGQIGLTSGIELFVSRFPAERRRLTRLYVGVGGTLTVAVALVAALAGVLAGNRPAALGGTETRFLVIAVALSITLFDGAWVLTTALRRFGTAALIVGTATIAPALATAIAAATGSLSVNVALIVWAAGRIVMAAVGLALVVHGSPRTGTGQPATPEVLGYGGRAFGAALSGVVTMRADQWVLGFMAGTAPLGIYAVAVSASDPLSHVVLAAQRGFYPHITRETDDPVRLTERTARGLLAAIIACTLIATPIGYILLPAVFGAAFAAAQMPFLLLMPGAVGLSLLSIFSAAIRATGAPGRSSIVELSVGATMLTLDLILIPPFGPSGAALASTIAYTLGGLAAMESFRRLHGAGRLDVIPRPRDVAAVVTAIRRRRSASKRSPAPTSGP